MRLRYAGTCRACGAALAAGTTGVYDRSTKSVTCVQCPAPGPLETAPPAAAGESAPPPPAEVAAGAAGSSARREYERRSAAREKRVRDKHPRIGGFLLAISEEPQSTTAWARGAKGEEMLGRGLDSLADKGVRLLHDRRIPRTRANIDHVAVTPSGVYVIDAKRYAGRPTLRVEGGLIRPRTSRLVIGSRDGTKLVEGMHKQVGLVLDALAAAGVDDVPVHGMLCFVDADWPLIGGSFQIDGVSVLWPRKAYERLTSSGPLIPAVVDELHRGLAKAFPVA
ncbi:MAG: NERD domain-containing protein [Cellulomonadaceae bacterium]|nr:NERD domain-containing protein [Cellulomonadaceae bacterium]